MVEIEGKIEHPHGDEAILAAAGKARCTLDLAPCCPYRFANPEMDAIFDPPRPRSVLAVCVGEVRGIFQCPAAAN